MHFDTPVLIDKTIEWFLRNQTKNYRVDMTLCDELGGICAFCGITDMNHNINKGETYIFTSPDAQRSGLGTEALRQLCSYGFLELGLNKVYAWTNEDNVASIRLHQKVGYQMQGRFREEYRTSSGELKDRIYLELLRKDWKP